MCEKYGDEEAVIWVTRQYLDRPDVPRLQIVAAILDPPFCCVRPWGLFACGFPQQTVFSPPWFLPAASSTLGNATRVLQIRPN